ncbi:MAG: NADH-quinone oxidoreductase subunit B family protein [Coriobacteriia bacterium]|nr:NADH-quinone oxidoreductase subunit B family protein [Coriobacteriia bacterium]
MALVDKLGESLDRSQGSIILTSLDAVMDWARGKSLWAMPMGTACCAMELIAGSFNKFDFDRHGTFPRPDPRHTDVMVVAGTITRKMQPAVRRLYEQMPDPKWVIAMGNCAVSGGIFYYDTYSVIRGIDEFLPVDVYIAGCPPRPEALQDAVLMLREKIATESIAPGKRRERNFTLPTSGDVTLVRAGGQEPSAELPTSAAWAPTEGDGA